MFECQYKFLYIVSNGIVVLCICFEKKEWNLENAMMGKRQDLKKDSA